MSSLPLAEIYGITGIFLLRNVVVFVRPELSLKRRGRLDPRDPNTASVQRVGHAAKASLRNVNLGHLLICIATTGSGATPLQSSMLMFTLQNQGVR